mmetsp:Transcript_102913/g.332034  ORF Transcript_102913/g.332034 Transcript_102913/m.332034 type:complete len:245 (+) Transcript_102913:862-1596(+)
MNSAPPRLSSALGCGAAPLGEGPVRLKSRRHQPSSRDRRVPASDAKDALLPAGAREGNEVGESSVSCCTVSSPIRGARLPMRPSRSRLPATQTAKQAPSARRLRSSLLRASVEVRMGVVTRRRLALVPGMRRLPPTSSPVAAPAAAAAAKAASTCSPRAPALSCSSPVRLGPRGCAAVPCRCRLRAIGNEASTPLPPSYSSAASKSEPCEPSAAEVRGLRIAAKASRPPTSIAAGVPDSPDPDS